jgi:type IV pilus assembly protein PilV
MKPDFSKKVPIHNKASLPKNARGFSLIEVLIALLIFSIGLLAVVAMQSTALKNKTFSDGISQAMREANQNEAERLLSLDYDDAALTASTTHGPTLSADGNYSTTYTVADNDPDVGLKRVVVTTTWNDFKGAHSVSLEFTKDNTL